MNFRAYASSSAGNLYTVSEQDSVLAIECGVRMPLMRQLLGFGVTGLDGLLLSHHHGDHARAVREVMRAGVDVYASAGTWAALACSGHRAHLLEPMCAVQVGPWQVLPFEAVHDADGALCFLIAGPGGGKLLYACDTAYVTKRFRSLTHVAVECNYSVATLRASPALAAHRIRVMRHHMSLERVVEMLEANDLSAVREVWLLHLSDAHSDEQVFQQTVAEVTGKPVHIAPRRWGGSNATHSRT